MEFDLARLQPKERASFALRALYEAAGCRKYHMGRFEEYGLYQENRSFLSSEQVITFTDLDGRLLALKPDVTLSIAKTAQPAPGETLKYYYHENVYRPSAESHTFKEISQMGLELLGEVKEPEVRQTVCLAAQSLEQMGQPWVLEISHMGYLFGLFDALGVQPAARPGLLETLRAKNIHELRAAAKAAGLSDEDHPARDMQDTFFVEANPEHVQGNVILRTHTSSVQSRVMESTQPPIRIICPGRVYRNEAISYRAHAFFHQVEALYIDKNVSFTDLKQVLLLFAKEMFGAETQIRLRPSYFPFTEPSAEMDISCNICGGKGCPFCKGTGWVEILGCGMVDPNVLEANGIDSKVYSGYALGMGIERITNLKYRVNDLRLFSENDTRFLKEFEAAN